MVDTKSRRRRRRRLNLKHRNKDNEWKIIHTNIRGIDSKLISLGSILSLVKPSVLTINETMLKGNRKLSLQGFHCFPANRACVDGGGVATCVEVKDRQHTLKVHEGVEGQEFLITRHDQFATAINVINLYGNVESRSSNDKIEERWTAIADQVKKIEAKGELLVLIGDINAHVGDIIEGNISKISHSGHLIRQFVIDGDYVLLNSTDKVKGGPFMRVDQANDACKSTLDLCIVSRELLKYVDSLIIDKDRNFTPYRPIDKKRVSFTDHYSLLVTFKNIPLASNRAITNGARVMWNTNREGGWTKYEELTTENKVLDELALQEDGDSDKMMKKLSKEMNDIKYKSFGKVKVKQNSKADKELVKLHHQKESLLANIEVDEEAVTAVDSEIAETLMSKQRIAFQDEINDILSTKKNRGKSAAVFQLKEKVVGPKCSTTEAVSLIDPVTGVEVDSAAGIRQMSLEFCCRLLTNREPNEAYRYDIEAKKNVHMLRMKSVGYEDPMFDDLSENLFNETYNRLKKSSSKYNFIMKAGKGLKPALFNLCRTVWLSEKLPTSWCDSTLIQIYKGSG